MIDLDVQTARAALAALEAAAAEASTAVTRGREDHAIGRLSRGDLKKLQLRLNRAIEAVEGARSLVRGRERQAAEEADRARASRLYEAQEAAAPLLAERTKLLTDFRSFVDNMLATLDGFDRRFENWNTRQAAVRARGPVNTGDVLQRPSNMRAVWYPLTGSLSKLALIYEDIK